MGADPRSQADCIKRVRRVLAQFEEASLSPGSVTVTELARKLASPKSHGGDARAGLKAHNIWGDPYAVCGSREVWTPLPLAYKLGGTWIYGVADLVRFVDCKPVEVAELKYFTGPDRYSETQVKVYAWLASKCFECEPRAYLLLGWDGARYRSKLEVKYEIRDIEGRVCKVLKSISRSKQRKGE